jgi:hypothetical protein
LAAFDESGKLADTDIVVFAGSVATADHWSVLCDCWLRALGEIKVPYLSMKDAMHLRGPWRELYESVRDSVLVKLAEKLDELAGFHIAAPMSSKEFRALPQSARQMLKDPQYCGFEACIRGMVEGIRNPALKVAFYYDSSEQYAEGCLKLYQRVRAKNAAIKHRCVSLTFTENEQYPLIQAADMLLPVSS